MTGGLETGPDLTGDGRGARDPDGDGLYEDVNGDGEVTMADATVLFNAVSDGRIASDDLRFDFSGDGEVSVADPQALGDMIFEGEAVQGSTQSSTDGSTTDQTEDTTTTTSEDGSDTTSTGSSSTGSTGSTNMLGPPGIGGGVESINPLVLGLVLVAAFLLLNNAGGGS